MEHNVNVALSFLDFIMSLFLFFFLLSHRNNYYAIEITLLCYFLSAIYKVNIYVTDNCEWNNTRIQVSILFFCFFLSTFLLNDLMSTVLCFPSTKWHFFLHFIRLWNEKRKWNWASWEDVVLFIYSILLTR